LITAADISPDGSEIVARALLGGCRWTRTTDQSIAAALQAAPQFVTLAVEKQGEAICFTPDATALLTISEGSPTALFELRRD
jgi:hypothetical protein